MKNIIVSQNPKSPVSEAFRTLRTNLQFSTIDDSIKSLVVTSPGPGEGKSTVIANLAVTMAQSGKKVLLIDCDLRKPSIHKKLGIPNSGGMTNLLIQKKQIDECIMETEIQNLYVITSGPIPPNPAELLGSKRMKSLIKEFENVFDVTLIDAPPVLAVTDAQILSTICSGIILTTAYGESEKEAVIKAKDLLDKTGSKILGVVLNKIPMKNSRKYGKYYGKYYGAYYEQDK
ncbi:MULTISPECIES: CpsD/CapB family tyrosine-protein kinase [Clostridium]|uniref:non-specific protein-tyrosine kinase n=1 Tax=Clostridium cadaveris TaxID=1529 RepID=A0A1I2J8W4_9CLOT|nr:CpsD/CapB family tyrosine-protein kinase [Clostridium cadaveris]MDM8312484.1 CpsD/CapB family tyrosine-protein kinase [Clostridium cadaveris]MDU4951488.1 CpsD/CapB family tyrosine-protein kinase [Clostridium sp.]NWK10247.1 CpsD/CapB family tyrosine-protein kinase [Clostridium cadaveris]SFF49366.1 capsular exopolysaccharide family [Clostridium cadaveris]